MDFTYSSYIDLLDLLKRYQYNQCTYQDWENKQKCVILRHDIDFDIERAAELAKLEETHNTKSTYFVLLTSDFYNVFSKRNKEYLQAIRNCGHEIGLHFDEVRYEDTDDLNTIIKNIRNEAAILSDVLGERIKVVSMHRPSKKVLDGDIQIPGMINSYSQKFFKEFKYVSDSRRRWREPVEELIQGGEYQRFHILTHAFWYNLIDKDIHESIADFINCANSDRYKIMQENITDLQSIMNIEEIR